MDDLLKQAREFYDLSSPTPYNAGGVAELREAVGMILRYLEGIGVPEDDRIGFEQTAAIFDGRCPNCNGEGGWQGEGTASGWTPCHRCEGTGHLLTDEGKALVARLK
jgi:hypothetical protein